MKTLTGLVLAGLLGFIGSANAAIITFLEDHLTLVNQTHSYYEIDDVALYSGPALGQTISQSATTEVTGDPTIEGSFYSATDYNYWEGFGDLGMSFNYSTGHPSFGDISAAGHNRIMTELMLVFQVSGDSATVEFSGTQTAISLWSIATFDLIDLTTSAHYSGQATYSLLSDHYYVLHHSFFMQTQADLYPGHSIAFNGVTVPEPISLILLGTGLAGLGFSRRLKKSH